MSTPDLVETRGQRAFDAIMKAFGTPAADDHVNLFVEHHLAELPPDYWLQTLGVATPDPAAVARALTLRSAWGEADAETFDFTLPGDVTDYVVAVHFDADGAIDGISMES